MSDLEACLRDTLLERSNDAPAGAQLLDAVHRREDGSRRQRAVAAASSATVVVAVIATAAALLTGGRSTGPAVAGKTSTDRATATPDGSGAPSLGGTDVLHGEVRRVSFGKVALRVPAQWKLNDLRCGTPMSNTVIVNPPSFTPDCLVMEPSGITVVRLERDDTTAAKSRAAVATTATTVDGQQALIGTGIPEGDDRAVTTLYFPLLDLVVSIETPTTAQAQALLGTVQVDQIVPASPSASAPACRASQLRAAASWEGDTIDRGRLHGLVYSVTLRNIEADCEQPAITDVSLVSSLVPLRTTPLPPTAARRTVTIRRGKSAVLTLVWLPSYCGPALDNVPGLLISLDGSKVHLLPHPASTVPLPHSPSCTGGNALSRLQNLGFSDT